MPKRINDYTIQFDAGEEVPAELGWWTGAGAGARFDESYVRQKVDPEVNFVSRNIPWGSLKRIGTDRTRGVAKHTVCIAAPKEVLDAFFIPKFNEYGEVAP